MKRIALIYLAGITTAACVIEGEPAGGVEAIPQTETTPTLSPVLWTAPTFPQGWPDAFGLGVAATEEEIRAWDIDVMPDGTGLPPGSGSVTDGANVYRERCAACHGETGTEGPNDRLVGREPREGFPFAESPEVRAMRTIGNYWPYATTIFDYVNRAMPQNAPGSLTADEVYAVTAFLLYRNEIVAEDAVMNAQTLPAVAMPARDRFVEDNRLGGPAIR